MSSPTGLGQQVLQGMPPCCVERCLSRLTATSSEVNGAAGSAFTPSVGEGEPAVVDGRCFGGEQDYG